ncbi:hypothetical protein G9A89_022653 [Geosiphon pyriformis]|nr:hypothetical protein G9A89_022653 [Geosiphon pyriformis]
MESKASSVDSLSDLKNMKNIVAEETSYANLDNFVVNNIEDDVMPRKTCTCTYVLGQPSKTLLFDVLSGDKDMVALLSLKFKDSNQLLNIKSCVSEKKNFEPVKFFALDIELLAISEKSVSDKLISIKKIFYRVDGFGGGSASSKFPEIIRSLFTLELSLNKTKEMAICEKILVNDNLRKANSQSDWEVIIKEISVNLPKLAIELVCIVVCFDNEAFKLVAIGSVPVYKGINLHWAGFFLACCAKCKQLGHISDVCSISENFGICHKQVVSSQNQVYLANIYRKKQALVVHPVSFGGKTWAQIVGSSSFYVVLLVLSGAGSLLSTKSLVLTSNPLNNSGLANYMTSLECSIEFLSDQVSEILRKLSFVDLVSVLSPSYVLPLVVAVLLDSALVLDMAVNSMVVPSSPSLLVIDNAIFNLSLSSSKVLTTKTNRNHWKFNIKNANEITWSEFKDTMMANAAMFFSFLKHWNSLDPDKASVIQVLVGSSADSDCICSAFFDYANNNAFSEVIDIISYENLVCVVKDLSDGKAAGLSGITNKLWKYCDGFMLGILLDLLNICLVRESTARKVLSKLLSDRILSACNVFNVLHDNFSMLKGTITQSPIFAIGSVDMWKAYNSVSWPHLQNIKRQESLCGYCIDSKFVAKTGRLETHGGLTLFLAAGAFVDDTIWVRSSQAVTQYILDIASEFFSINNISINNKKTVAILINRKIEKVLLSISGLPILIAHKEESYRYLGIYLSFENLSKPSLAKAHSDVRFFVNLILRKTILDKQFLYLVSAVLQPIAGLPKNFPNEAFHHPSLYGLKSFKQLQAECKIVFVLSFSNAGGILDHLFIYKSLDLQVLSWLPVHSLCHPVRLHINLVNNYLAGVSPDISSLKDVLQLKQCFFTSNLNVIEVYTDGFLKNFGMREMRCSAAAYFLDVDLGIGIKVGGLVSSTLVELQMIALALECVPSHSCIVVYSDSQTALDACVVESVLVSSDFHNYCWMKWCGVVNLIKNKRLSVSWHKVKGHSSVMGNNHADKLANSAAGSSLVLSVLIKEIFIEAGGVVVSAKWYAMSGLGLPLSRILQMLSLCISDNVLYTALSKDFLFRDWYLEAVAVLDDAKSAGKVIIDFV